MRVIYFQGCNVSFTFEYPIIGISSIKSTNLLHGLIIDGDKILMK
jgi:hypothetical protein